MSQFYDDLPFTILPSHAPYVSKPSPRSQAPTEPAPYKTIDTKPKKCSNWFKDPDDDCQYDMFKLALAGAALFMLTRKG